LRNRRVKDHILLLLAIKPPEKIVDIDHIVEKVSRNSGATKSEIVNELNELIKDGYVKVEKNGYAITDLGRQSAWRLAYDPEMTLSYRLVLLARFYYPRISDIILPFLRERPVSVVKVFSDENDPIRKIKPIFSRYRRLKPKTYHFINTKKDLIRYVDMHAIDFIPYVHRVNKDYPDWLVIDIDAGDDIKNAGDLGFQYIKEIVKETYIVMRDELRLTPYIKFSGSRGFQIWVTFTKPLGRFEDYRKSVNIIRDIVENRLRDRYDTLREKYGDLVYEPITTSTVAKKELRKKQILLDWSSMKEEGDVRAPWSMHYKTGLVSVPLYLKDLDDFSPDDARVEKVVEMRDRLRDAFAMAPSDPSELLKKLGKSGLLAFFG